MAADREIERQYEVGWVGVGGGWGGASKRVRARKRARAFIQCMESVEEINF